MITPYVLAYRTYPNDAAVARVLQRAMSLAGKAAPFFKIDDLVLDRLADLPVFASASPGRQP